MVALSFETPWALVGLLQQADSRLDAEQRLCEDTTSRFSRLGGGWRSPDPPRVVRGESSR
jgi:hypothetical protein